MKRILRFFTMASSHSATPQAKLSPQSFKAKYATSIVDDVDVAGGRYPVVVEEVYNDGSSIRGARRHVVACRDDLSNLGRQLDSIVTSGYWRVSYCT
jgi:hypothetical protein